MRTVLRQLGQYKRDTFFCIGLTTLEVIMEILLPFITAIIIDEGLEKANLSVVYRYGALMVVMAFCSLIFGAAAGKFAASASSGFAANLRESIYSNIQTFSFSNIDKFSVPGLVTRMSPCPFDFYLQLHHVPDHQPQAQSNLPAGGGLFDRGAG